MPLYESLIHHSDYEHAVLKFSMLKKCRPLWRATAHVFLVCDKWQQNYELLNKKFSYYKKWCSTLNATLVYMVLQNVWARLKYVWLYYRVLLHICITYLIDKLRYIIFSRFWLVLGQYKVSLTSKKCRPLGQPSMHRSIISSCTP